MLVLRQSLFSWFSEGRVVLYWWVGSLGMGDVSLRVIGLRYFIEMRPGILRGRP